VTLGKVTTVFSAKGGTGVTTVATNLAVALRLLTDKEVLLVDLAPALGTAAVAMGVHPRYTYLDVIQNFHRIDEDLFRSFLEVDESGVHVLASPPLAGGNGCPGGEELQGLWAFAASTSTTWWWTGELPGGAPWVPPPRLRPAPPGGDTGASRHCGT
jgi:hypothetical protein